MEPLRLYIKDFMCYDHAFIDFSNFSSALIIGKQENNDMYSNGVGKSSIFKAIKYVLFNQVDFALEKLIRDDTNICQVVFDFLIDGIEYRLSRTRTKKGSTDLSLLQRNNQLDSSNEAYHIIEHEIEKPILGKDAKKFWKDLSGSRAGDTERDLIKLLKINYKSFSSTVLFPQNDMMGLSTATPEKRKGILKEAFNLLIYAKLEKMTKDKLNSLHKEIEKNKNIIDNLDNPEKDILDINIKLINVQNCIDNKLKILFNLKNDQVILDEKILSLNNLHIGLENNFKNFVDKQQQLLKEISGLETYIQEYQIKKNNIAKSAAQLISEIKLLNVQKLEISKFDFNQIDILAKNISSLKNRITELSINIKNDVATITDLKDIGSPSNGKCKSCSRLMTDADIEKHQNHVSLEIKKYEKSIISNKESLEIINPQISKSQKDLDNLTISKSLLNEVNTNITMKDKEILDKKILHKEHSTSIDNYNLTLKDKSKELSIIKDELKKSSLEEANTVKSNIEIEKNKLKEIIEKISSFNEEINHLNKDKAVLDHTLEIKSKDKIKKEEVIKTNSIIENSTKIYPLVIQAFSSTGIPYLIIQNILDDFQIETNKLLDQLKPGLQLSFFLEKTRSDGEQADTLDINYHINGKERYHGQLSGAQQLAIAFSLKLGLAFLLRKMTGANIKFLLLDEIDQSLDKASVNAFTDIIKFFQKEFKILIITHNDTLKDKFSHSILVEQDIEMISRARVVSL